MESFLSVEINVPQEVKDGVVAALPMVNDIGDSELRAKTIEAWALSLCLNGYADIRELPGSGMPDAPEIGDQSHHLLGVARIALGIKDALEATMAEPLGVDRDILLAAALLHDVGKTWEYRPDNIERWSLKVSKFGKPSLRHPAYGAHIAMLVGLPEEVVNTCGCHSPEGRYVERSLTATIVHYADDAYWFTLEKAHDWEVKIPRL